MAATEGAGLAVRQELVRGRAFDATFIGGLATLSILTGAVVVFWPALFPAILILDVWFLGYHHVIATFTRFAAAPGDGWNRRALLTWVPLVVFGSAMALGIGVGVWALMSVYLYWQWFHYTRQSWGIARIYQRRAGLPAPESDRVLLAAFYGLPVAGILYRSHQNPGEFLGLEVRTVPVPAVAVQVALAAAAAAGALLVAARYRAWRQGRLPVAHTLYLASHGAVFAVAYLIIDDIDFGWLAVNIWHNAQYLLLVWHVNDRETDLSGAPRLLRALIERRSVIYYFSATFVASTVLYLSARLTVAVIVGPIIVFQAVNFHHYIVDGIIWRSRRPDPRSRLRSLVRPAS